jgi:hypothetical protein
VFASSQERDHIIHTASIVISHYVLLDVFIVFPRPPH